MPELEELLSVALDAAHIGGSKLLEYFERTTSVQKQQSYNLVTEADLESEKAIIKFINKRFPDHEILGEESQNVDQDLDAQNTEHLWIIDPLDGTNNFVHGIPHFAVSIAYVQSGKPKVGVVFNPITGELFQATFDSVSLRNGKPISVDSANSLGESIVGVGFYYDRETTMKPTLDAIEAMFGTGIHGIRRLGTASLDLCNVACGRFGAYFEFELAPWDYAGGWLVVLQAGGTVTQCDGKPLNLKNCSVLSSNGILHDDALAITKAHLPIRHTT